MVSMVSADILLSRHHLYAFTVNKRMTQAASNFYFFLKVVAVVSLVHLHITS